ncbi:Adipocyte plasma membrane-associated protein [Schistosoma japonicum]|uniref:Adipocyte plasma membrane-associated protein n=1 Tax=Schistosoma japonicum TaxID=6182 RepID=A0A4Z2DND8_SCHJA|nr:Adipocyte plasma membrane-associated protein [Schistosoma japonicum]
MLITAIIKYILAFILLILIGFIIQKYITQTYLGTYQVTPSVELDNQLIANKNYGKLQKFDLANYSGPESFVNHGGSLYTSVIQGEILRITNSEIYTHAKLGLRNCVGFHECGRPLGLKLFNNSEYILVTDAYLGVYSISIESGSVKKLFPMDARFSVTFFDDAVILPNGSLIITEASTKYFLEQLWSALLEGAPSGRLIMVDTKTGEYSHILGDLLLRLSLDSGKVTVFADGLPGFPDNIKSSPRGGYWVPLSNLRDEPLSAFLLKYLPSFPRIRQLISGFISIFPFKITPNGKSSMLIRLDENGKIIEILNDFQNELPNACEVLEHDNTLYIGSYYLSYFGKLERLSN